MMRVLPAPSLASLTTLRIGGLALAEIRLDEPADFDALPGALVRTGGMPVILGGGSNLLIAGGDLPLTLVRPLYGEGKDPVVAGERIDEQGRQQMLIRVGAGLRMPALLAWCAAHGLTGLEGLVGVPGRVGGAVAMNAGAYGSSLGGVLAGLTVFTPERGLHSLTSDGWTTAYRHFALAEPCAWFAVAEAVLALTPADPAQVRATMAGNLARKKQTQPVMLHTAGCVFRNPEGLSAGKLLDEAGLRGKRRGPVYFTEQHANFLAHDLPAGRPGTDTDEAFAAAADLITEAREAAARTAGINLELEIKVWPCPLF